MFPFPLRGFHALALMAMQPFDVVISDLVMPGLDGNPSLEAVSERYPSTIRFISTGKTETPTVMAGIAPGTPIYSQVF